MTPLERARAAAHAEMKRPVASWRKQVLGVAVLQMQLVTVGLLTLPHSTTQASSGLALWSVFALWGVTALVGTSVALMPPRRWGAWLSIGAAFVAATATVGFASNLGPAGGSHCAVFELEWAMVPAAVLLMLQRRFALSWRASVSAGLAASATGLMILHPHCPDGSIAHLASFHLAPVAIVALLAVFARRSLSTKAHAP